MFEYKTKDLYSMNGQKKIYGKIYIPKYEKTKMPTLIFSHGFSCNYKSGEVYAEFLAKMGFVVYCFDFCGGGLKCHSDGSILEMSIFTEKNDLKAVVETISNLEFTDSDNLFLMGESQGAAVSAMYASKNKDAIKGLILKYPAFLIPDDVRETFPKKEDIPDEYFMRWMTVGRIYAEDVYDYDIFDDIKDYDRNVLIVHGDCDSCVPISYSEKAKNLYKNAELKIIKGADHGFTVEEDKFMIKFLKEFLSAHTECEKKEHRV